MKEDSLRLPRRVLLVVHVLVLMALPSPGQDRPLIWDLRRDAVIERIREFDALIAAANWPAAVTLAQRLLDESELDEDAGRVVPLHPDAGAEGIFFPIGEYVTRRLVSMPPEGLARYRDAFGPAAEGRVESAIAWNDVAALEDTARRFRATRAGARALRRLAESDLESGRFGRAALRFEDLLEVRWRRTNDDPDVRGAAAGRLLAGALAGEAPVAVVAGRAVVAAWRPTIDVPDRTPPDPEVPLATAWTSPHVGGVGSTDGLLPWPCVVGDRVVYHTRGYARALDLRTGAILWTRSFAGDVEKDGDADLFPTDSPHVRSLRGACDGHRYVFASRSRGKECDRSELVALAVDNGRILWRRPALPGPAPDGDGAIWDAAPMILGNAVLASAVDRGEIPTSWVARLDLASGALQWRARIGAGVPLPYRDADGEDRSPAHWIGCSPMAREAGLLFVCDNLGTLACLEADSGLPRWCFRYPRRRVDGSGAFDTGALARGWDSEPVLVERGVVVAAPDDGDALHVLFARPPGDAVRRAANANYLRADSIAREGMKQLIAMKDGEIWVSGRSTLDVGSVVRKLTPFGRERLEPWNAPAPLDGPVRGRAKLAQKRVYVCSDRYVYGIDRSSGSVSDPILSPEDRGRTELGHPVPTQHGLVVAGLDAVRLHRAAEDKR